MTLGKKKNMPRKKSDAVRVQQPALASQYRAIGPAAIVAALLHTSKKRKPAPLDGTKAA